MEKRNIEHRDLVDIVALNNENTPAVSELSIQSLSELLAFCKFSWIFFKGEELVGFCLIMGPGTTYGSDNYQWVSQNYDSFQYLDRVVLVDKFRGKGFGRRIYETWFAEALTVPKLVEVNIRPINEESLKFHKALGFRKVGEQDTEGGKKRVRYLFV